MFWSISEIDTTAKWYSVPDLEKIIRLSKLFGVTTDYLLKDEIELDEEAQTPAIDEETLSGRYVSLEEANTFLEVKTMTSRTIAYGVFLCIISPICLLMLGVLSESGKYGLSENMAGRMDHMGDCCCIVPRGDCGGKDEGTYIITGSIRGNTPKRPDDKPAAFSYEMD